MDIKTLGIYLNCLLIWTEIIKMRIILKRRRRIMRRWWVKPHFYTNIRHNLGAHQKLFMYFQTNDHDGFYNFTRMSVQQFNLILIGLNIGKLSKFLELEFVLASENCMLLILLQVDMVLAGLFIGS